MQISPEFNDRYGDGLLIEAARRLGLQSALAEYLGKRWSTGAEAVAAVEELKAAITAARQPAA